MWSRPFCFLIRGWKRWVWSSQITEAHQSSYEVFTSATLMKTCLWTSISCIWAWNAMVTTSPHSLSTSGLSGGKSHCWDQFLEIWYSILIKTEEHNRNNAIFGAFRSFLKKFCTTAEFASAEILAKLIKPRKASVYPSVKQICLSVQFESWVYARNWCGVSTVLFYPLLLTSSLTLLPFTTSLFAELKRTTSYI